MIIAPKKGQEMDIMSGISAAAQALDLIKRVQEISDGLKDAELNLKISELSAKLSEVTIALSEAKLALQAKNEEIYALKERADKRVDTVSIGAYEYGLNPDGSNFPRPFCPKCLQTSGMQVSLSRGTVGQNVCPACKATYNARETNARL